MNRKKQELWNMFPVYCLIGCCLLIFKGGLVFGPFVFILFFGQLRQIDKEEKEYEERMIRDRRANMTPEEIREDIWREKSKKRDEELRKKGLVYDSNTGEIISLAESNYRFNKRLNESSKRLSKEMHLYNLLQNYNLSEEEKQKCLDELDRLRQISKEEQDECERRKAKEIEEANR